MSWFWPGSPDGTFPDPLELSHVSIWWRDNRKTEWTFCLSHWSGPIGFVEAWGFRLLCVSQPCGNLCQSRSRVKRDQYHPSTVLIKLLLALLISSASATVYNSFLLVFLVFQSSLEQSLLNPIPPAFLCVKKADWLWNRSAEISSKIWKHFRVEVGEIDGWDFGVEVWAIRLLCEIRLIQGDMHCILVGVIVLFWSENVVNLPT